MSISTPATLQDWLDTPQGRYVLRWEEERIEQAVTDVFGFHALQLGMPQCDFLHGNRIPLRARIGDAAPVEVYCDLRQLPFAANSIDLIVLPHVLEFHEDPHQILREVERVLIAEGQVVIVGFNPLSLWGACRRLRRGQGFPWDGRYLSVLRLKDWLALLGFEVNRGNFGCYAPPFKQQKWLQRSAFLELAGDRWWGFAGGVYMIRAVKRVVGMRLLQPSWRDRLAASKALAPITGGAMTPPPTQKNQDTQQ
jgi:SAM-dependent methyltransferase